MANENVPQVNSGFKVCKACGDKKPLEGFHLEPRVKDGRTATCIACLRERQRAYARLHPERIKESREKYAARFPERIQAARKFTLRRLALERREARLAAGKPFLEAKVTDDGRLCSRCRKRRPSEEFPPNRQSKDGLSYYCRSCTNAVARKLSKKPETAAYRKRYMRALGLRKYGITPEAFDEIFRSQDGACAICSESLRLGTGGCAVDHDHKTNKVRGLLCRLCNVGVGHFRENEQWLLKAIEYLRRSR